MKNLHLVLEGNWEELKGYIKKKWGKLTDNDIDKINGSFEELSGKLQKLYGQKNEEVDKEINVFLESIDFTTFEDQTKNKMRELKSFVSSILDQYFMSALKKTINAEKAVVDYARNNPIKLVGLATVAGLIIGLYQSKES